jgi:Predicted nucleotide-binding protein containing TIR-like domain
MTTLSVSRSQAEEILAEQRTQGQGLVESAKQIQIEAAYKDWRHDRDRWIDLTEAALRYIYGREDEANEFDKATHPVMHFAAAWPELLKSSCGYVDSGVHKLISFTDRLRFVSETATVEINEGAKAAHTHKTGESVIFLVHGRDHGKRDTVARFLQNAGPGDKPIILDELANRGRTLVEKLEQHGDDSKYAVVLLTGDDEGGLTGTPAQPRARQNVILELGWFCGLIGRERVAVLHEPGVELPSDIDGLAYIPLTGDWEKRLVRELRDAGFDYSLDRLD